MSDLWIDRRRGDAAFGHAVRFNGSKGERLGGVYFGEGSWWGWCRVEVQEVTSGHFTRQGAADQLRQHYLIEHKQP